MINNGNPSSKRPIDSQEIPEFTKSRDHETKLRLTRNNTQTAVTNMTIKRILENKFINLTFRMFQHTSSEVLVTVCNRSSN